MAKPGSIEDFESQIRALRQNYVHSLPEKKRLISELWRKLNQRRFAITVAQELNRRVHNLVGSGGLHGFPGISDAARDIETLLSGVLDDEHISPEVVAQFNPLFQTLERSIDDSDPENDIDR